MALRDKGAQVWDQGLGCCSRQGSILGRKKQVSIEERGEAQVIPGPRSSEGPVPVPATSTGGCCQGRGRNTEEGLPCQVGQRERLLGPQAQRTLGARAKGWRLAKEVESRGCGQRADQRAARVRALEMLAGDWAVGSIYKAALTLEALSAGGILPSSRPGQRETGTLSSLKSGFRDIEGCTPPGLPTTFTYLWAARWGSLGLPLLHLTGAPPRFQALGLLGHHALPGGPALLGPCTLALTLLSPGPLLTQPPPHTLHPAPISLRLP